MRENQKTKIEITITSLPGTDDKDPALNISFAVDDETRTNSEYAEKAATWAATKQNLTLGRCYIWRIKGDDDKRSGGGIVAVGLAVTACEFPREVTRDETDSDG